MTLTIIKLFCLFLGAWFTFINTANTFGKDGIPTINFLLQAVGVVGFIIIQFKLYQ